jgi:hypothetical protein
MNQQEATKAGTVSGLAADVLWGEIMSYEDFSKIRTLFMMKKNGSSTNVMLLEDLLIWEQDKWLWGDLHLPYLKGGRRKSGLPAHLTATFLTILQGATGFIRGILRGVRYAKSLRVLFSHRRSPSRTTLVLYSRVVFFFNEPTRRLWIKGQSKSSHKTRDLIP